MDCPDGELSILIVDNPRIQALNREYRHKDRPTNVLSFSMREGDFPNIAPQLLGDVVISADTAAAEASRAGISTGRHLAWLLVHGILHLFGFDHEKSPQDAEEMETRTRDLMQDVKSLYPEDFR